MKLKLFLLTVLSVVGILLPPNVLAAGTLSVRLGQPKSPTNQNSLKLTFVSLDLANREITVSCYKKSPSDADYVKFDTDKNLIAGGNTDYCDVTSSILSTSGTYSFKVSATAGADTIWSNISTVNYNTSGPSTPGSYSKERIDDCNYKIKFRTADDGKTTKVELFRSDTTSIAVNSGNIASSLTIAPNTEGEIINRVPVCGKDYYFVIRAVDSSDNVSDTTGDSFTTTTTTTTTSATETTGQSAIVIGSGSQVTEGAASEGGEAAISPTGTPSTEQGTPSVLGTETSKKTLKWLSIPLILVAVYFFLKSRKRA